MEKKIYFCVDQRYENLVDKKLVPKELKGEGKGIEYLQVRKYLCSINYFKLKPYIKYIEKENDLGGDFNFNDAIDLYKFDRKLRGLLIKLIEMVEISSKAFITDFLYQEEEKTIFDYLNLDNFKNEKEISKFNEFKENLENKIDTITKNAKEELEKMEISPNSTTYFFTYEELEEIRGYFEPDFKALPFWIIAENLDFGDITNILKYLSKEDIKNIFKKIGKIGYPPKNISSSLNGVRYIRNMCSHNSRLYNQSIKYSMPMSTVTELNNSIGLIRYLLFIKIFVNQYDPNSWFEFCLSFEELLNSNKSIKLECLHLPQNYMDYLM